jgi:pimeloyl-ACP methyl ester carboxylesterase
LLSLAATACFAAVRGLFWSLFSKGDAIMIHRTRLYLAALVLWLAAAGLAAADTMVLVQGYLGSALSWRASGFAAVLDRNGWRDAGHLSLTRSGVIASGRRISAARRFYTIDVPTEAPLEMQAGMLSHYLASVRTRHPGEKIVLAGHSAGGVVARLVMVRQRTTDIDALVTIASPHLGTGAAETGLEVANSPIGWFAPLFGGGTLNRSRGLYHDLVVERPGSLLGWLNRQPHPDTRYIAIVRRNGGGSVVPDWSQDLNNVAALRGKSRTILTPPGHALRAADAKLVADVLDQAGAKAYSGGKL